MTAERGYVLPWAGFTAEDAALPVRGPEPERAQGRVEIKSGSRQRATTAGLPADQDGAGRNTDYQTLHPCWLQMPSAGRSGRRRQMIDLLRFVSGLAADLVRRHPESSSRRTRYFDSRPSWRTGRSRGASTGSFGEPQAVETESRCSELLRDATQCQKRRNRD